MTSSLDNLRIFLWVGLGLLIWMCVQAWQADYAPARRAGSPERPANPISGDGVG
jgi:threonine/homoserine/homoserine lactone efflux protein